MSQEISPPREFIDRCAKEPATDWMFHSARNALAAFDALLAVAKAANAMHMKAGAAMDGPVDYWVGINDVKAAARVLDAQHPGWREWAP